MENFRQVPFTDLFVNEFGTVKYIDCNGNTRCDKGFANKAKYFQIKVLGGRFYYIHRLVARCWVENPCPKYFNVVHHKDCNNQNNSAENLQWTTKKMNNAWKKNQKLVKKTRGGFFRVSFVYNKTKYDKTLLYKSCDTALGAAKKIKQKLINETREHFVTCANSNKDPYCTQSCPKCGHFTTNSIL